MGEFKNLLESSTIHGVAYLATTRKFARCFWLLVVISCFIGASLLIREAFKTWSDNPVSTTIETRPISELRFPKVTVCPPKDTLTDLNDILIRVTNKTFDYDTLNESTIGYQVLEKYTTYFQNEDFILTLSKVSSFFENERYKKWYFWSSSAKFPSQYSNKHNSTTIITVASYGVMSSPHFKEKLNFNKYEQLTTYNVEINSPFYVDASLIIDMEYSVLENNYECLKISGVRTSHISNCLNSEENFIQIEKKVKGLEKTTISFHRTTYLTKTSMTEILDQKEITGFKLSWNITTNNTNNQRKYPWYKETDNHIFIGFANLAHALEEHQITDFWKILRYLCVLSLSGGQGQ